MPEPLASAGADYLEQLLHAAIHVPAAAGDPASARIAGSLLASLAARHEDARLEPFFSWAGRPTSYEVRTYDEANRIVSRNQYPCAAEAIRAAGEWGNTGDHTAELVARGHDGEERSVYLVRERAPIYRLPESATVGADLAVDHPQTPAQGPGPGPTGTEVVETLREMLTGMTVHVDATAIEEAVREAVDDMARAVAVQVANLIPSAADIAERVMRTTGLGPTTGVAGPGARPVGSAPPPPYEPLDPAAQDALAAERARP